MLGFIDSFLQTMITFSQLLVAVLVVAMSLRLLSKGSKKYRALSRSLRRRRVGTLELAKLEEAKLEGTNTQSTTVAKTETRTLMPPALYHQTLYRVMNEQDAAACSVLSIKIDNYQHLKLKYGAHLAQTIIDLAIDRLLLAAKANDILCRVKEDEFSFMLRGRSRVATANTQRQIKAMLSVELPLAYNCNVMLITRVTEVLPAKNIKSNQ